MVATADRRTVPRQCLVRHPAPEVGGAKTGTLAPEPHRGGPPRVLSIAERCRLWDLVEEHGDYTLEELRQAGGFDCCLTTIWRALRRHGLTRKKKSMHADERDRPDVVRKRRSFRYRVRRIEPGRLHFVDESGANTAMARAYAWAPRGSGPSARPPGSGNRSRWSRRWGWTGACPAGDPGVARKDLEIMSLSPFLDGEKKRFVQFVESSRAGAGDPLPGFRSDDLEAARSRAWPGGG